MTDKGTRSERCKPLPPSLASVTTDDGMWRVIYEREAGLFGSSSTFSIYKLWQNLVGGDLLRLIRDTFQLGPRLFLFCTAMHLVRGMDTAWELYYSSRLIASVSPEIILSYDHSLTSKLAVVR